MKKYLLTFILSVAGLSIASADEPVQGIIATYEGSETSYKLEDMPTVKYETVEGVQNAVLYLKDQAEPVLSVALADGKKLTIAYGEYVPTGINGVALDKAVITEKGGKKFINGGKLIIIGKDGKMYNAAGVEIIK
ncbi:MAG: hypothetical protein KBT20_02230 [Bacteroidales bacterium]|nr:hypothetical protein [Candidatus Liminaster caballi]